jgi:hypothetical protein
VHLRTYGSDNVREKPRKIRRKICKERRRKTGITQIRLKWADVKGELEERSRSVQYWVSMRINIKPKKRVLGTAVEAAFQKRSGFGWHSGIDGGFRGWVVVVLQSEWDDALKK